MGVLNLDQLAPDGLLIIVDWDKLRPGSSVFIPCINTTAAKSQVKGVFARRGWTMRYAIRPEKGIWGIRFWRVS